MEYLQLSKSKSAVIASLSQKKMRSKHGLFCVEGHKSVEDTLGKFQLAYIVATERWLARDAEAVMQRYGVDKSGFYSVTETIMRQITSLSTPTEVIAVFYIPEDEVGDISTISPLAPGIYLLIDGVQDPGNLGTIIRTAHWFGIRRIFASRNTVDLYNPKTIQSAMGSMGSVDVVYTDLVALAKANPHLPLTGLMLEGRDIFQAQLPDSALIVMGNEGNGVSADLRDMLKVSLTIPPSDPKSHPESLNVAIATGITLAAFAGKSRG